MTEIAVSTYLTVRCPACPNQSSRSVEWMEKHILGEHDGLVVPIAEWIGLPTGTYRNGKKLEAVKL